MSHIALSVVVPTHGRPERIAALLERCRCQTLDPDVFEVIVVDDGSPVPTSLQPGEYPFQLVLVRQEQAGPGAARNRAIALAKAPLCLILNDDAVPADDLFARHIEVHAGRSEPVAVLGSFHFAPSCLQSPFVQVLEDSDLLFDFPRLRHGALHDWSFFWTCNLSLDTAVLRDSGGFDAEEFPEALCEDVELGLRIQKLGVQVLYREDLVAHHDHVLSPESWLDRMRRLAVYQLRIARKHGEWSLVSWTNGEAPGEGWFERLRRSYEAYAPSLDGYRAQMEKLEREAYGQTLDHDNLTQLQALTRRMGGVAWMRGAMQELAGFDPEDVLRNGPRQGVLSTVIGVSHNALAQTQRCLDHLRRNADPRFPIRILFVDNGSSDGSAEWLAAQADVSLIRNAENEGAPRARNQALAQAEGEWIVFLDNDAFVPPQWLERMRYHAEIDPFVACVGTLADRAAHGAQIELPFDPTDAGPEAVETFARELAANSHRQWSDAALLSSFCLLVRREVLEIIGGFDERFSPWGYEDDDLTLRCLLAGYHNRLAKDVFVHHEAYGGPKAERHDDLLLRNWQLFAEKWGLDAADLSGRDARIKPALARAWTRDHLHCPIEHQESEAGAAIPSASRAEQRSQAG